MRGAVLHGARDVRFEEREAPKLIRVALKPIEPGT
jgi:hypothetical protein